MLNWNWHNRPADERHDTLQGMCEVAQEQREKSKVRESAIEQLGVRATDDGDLRLVDPDGAQHKMTNWSFGQLCRSTKHAETGKSMPADEYRSMPAALAQIPMSWRLENARRDDAKLLITEDFAGSEARALTSPTYGRVWNAEMLKALSDYIDPDVWKPISSTNLVKSKSTALTLSDRDMYAFMVDDKNPIEVPGANGRDTLFRGFYAWNSEVGHRSVGIAAFMFRAACANRQIFGIKDFSELRIRHTSGAPDRWVREAVPALRNYVNSDPSEVISLVQTARDKEVAKSTKGVEQWLKDRGFTKGLARSAMERAETEEGNSRSLWNLVQGLTSIARDKPHQDSRVELEEKAGKLMRFAA